MSKTDISDVMSLLREKDKTITKLNEALKIAIEGLQFECGNRCNAEYNPCNARLALAEIEKIKGMK